MTPIRPITFWHQGTTRSVSEPSSTQTVLDWLRDDQQLTGTKEGCAEGDCGACTVVIGELDAHNQLQLKPVNSCIQFLPTLDGKALFTVEDLGGQHPVQQAMVDCHGSQCGFCTPGFVMSLWERWEQHRAAGTCPKRQQLADALAGNLCRCTGYRPILDAGAQAMHTDGPKLQREPIAAALRALARQPSLNTGSGFHAPRTLDELAALRLAKPKATLLAGSSDIGLWVNKQFRELGELIHIGQVAELKTIARTATALRIGAGASLDDAWAALSVQWPPLREVWLRFASPPVRSVGTMGGNVANGSPIGDSAPVLIALGSTIELRRGQHTRAMPLQDFYLDYMKNRLEPGEFVQAIRVPLDGGWTQVAAHKISKRFDSDISAVLGAFALRLDAEQRVQEVRLAWGGLAAIVKRSLRAEDALRGQRFDEAALQAAQAALAQDFQPLSDMRASSAYRLQVAQNLLRRLWLSSTQGLQPEQLSVWEQQR